MRSSQDSIFINQFVAVVFLCKYFQDALKVSWAKTISAKYKTILPCNSSCPQFRVSCSEEGCEWIRGIPKVFKKVAFPPPISPVFCSKNNDFATFMHFFSILVKMSTSTSWPQLEKFDIMMQTTGFVSLVYQLWDWPTAEGTAALINKHNFPANIHYKYLSIYKYLPVQYKYLI